jgi:multidrug transporter EmrE-like cation transporter
MGYFYIFGTIVFTVYGQIIIKYQMNKVGELPPDLINKILALLLQFKNIWILSGFFSAFLAALCWMATMTKFELSYAYPFMGLNFILVLFLCVIFFKEPLTIYKIIGTFSIIIGIYFIGK